MSERSTEDSQLYDLKNLVKWVLGFQRIVCSNTSVKLGKLKR